MSYWGAFSFGLVIGFVTYRTLRHKDVHKISDIAAVIAAVGGGAVLALFPASSNLFDGYAFGLATGFFFYLIASLIVGAIAGPGKAKEFLGDD
jgi:hypothetical protein